MKKGFFDNMVFRLLFPPFYGSIVYIMLLLVFDNIDQLFINFFTREIFICIILTYMLSESQRIGFFVLNKLYPLEKNLTVRIFWQMLYGLFSSLLIISVCLYFYFVHVIGYQTFRLELFSFNIIFGISSVFFNLLYFSIFLFNKKNEEELSNEEKMQKNLEYKMLALKNDVNPDFLYNSLESLISLLHKKPEKAENFIERFSDIYRYKLSNRNNEIEILGKELEIIQDYVFLSGYRFSENISMKLKLSNEVKNMNIIPGVLLVLIEEVVKRSSISEIQPLNFEIYSENKNTLLISYEKNNRLDPLIGERKAFEAMKKAYGFFSETAMEINLNNGLEIIKIPLLTISN